MAKSVRSFPTDRLTDDSMLAASCAHIHVILPHFNPVGLSLGRTMANEQPVVACELWTQAAAVGAATG